MNNCITAVQRPAAVPNIYTDAPEMSNGPPSAPFSRRQVRPPDMAPVDQVRNDLNEPFLKDSNNDPPTYEDVEALIGTSGLWQLKVFLLASFAGFCTSFHNLIYGFIGAIPDHWCALPDLPVNYSNLELHKRLTSGLSDDDSKCMQHPWTWNNANYSLIIDETKTVQCIDFEFDRSELESTIATEWRLVCDDAVWAPTIQITYMSGLLLGSPIFGAISDRFGRKPAILTASIIFGIAGPLIAFSPSFTVLLVLRFVLAFALPGVYACSYVLSIEIISGRWRSIAGNYFNLPFAVGYTVLPIIAYFVRSWKMLQLICSIPSIELIFTCWLLPESPRWLIRKGRLEKAEAILRRAAKVNKSEANIPENFSELLQTIYDQEKDDDIDGPFCHGVVRALNDYLRIVKSPRMRKLFLTLCFCWFTIGMTYYGLGLNSTNLSSDRYTYVFVGGLLEFPAYLMVPMLIKRLGRKRVFIGFTWTCAAALLTSLLLPKESFLITWLSYLGKLVIGANYSLVYLYSSELLPTVIRNFALGVCSMMARVGSTIAPFIVDIVGRGHHMYPSLILGSLALLTGCMALMLPETRNRPLPETIDEMEMKDFATQTDDEKSKTNSGNTEVIAESEVEDARL